jgi:hypothetical protein
MSFNIGQLLISPFKKPFSFNFLFRKAKKPSFNPTLLLDFKLKKAKELLSSAFLYKNLNQPTFNPCPLLDFGF